MNKFHKRFNDLRRALGKLDISLISIFLVVTFVAIYSISLTHWKRQDRIIASDVIHYYAYLPAIFVYDDITLDFIFEKPEKYNKIFWPVISDIDKNVITVTMGMSLLYSPAFLTTHLLTQLTGGVADGFSAPYRLGLIIIGWVYLFLALLMLRKLLLRYYSKYIVGFVFIIIVLGTNLFYYETAETTMSHGYSFFLFSAFMLLTVKWHERPTIKTAIFLGLVSGLIALVRPTNVLIGIVFVFWGIDSAKTFVDKFKMLKSNYLSLIVILIAAFFVMIPQFFYWKTVTGNWLYNGYGSDSTFYFSNPQIFNNLFSYRKGWLIYTPVMFFAFLGIAILWKKKRGIAIPIIIFSLLNLYIVSSWWSWWYGGGFGMRAYVETYAIYTLGFAAFAEWVFSKGKLFIKLSALALVLLLIGFNYFQIRQYHWGAIHYVGMTKEAYWHQFLVLKPYGDYYKKITIPDMQKAREGIYEFHNFE